MKISWELVDVARKDLVALLESLTEEQWDAQSLCSEWRVRDVVAHITSIARVGLGAMLWGVVTHGFNPNRFIALEARAHGEHPVRRLLSELRDLVGSRKKPVVLTPEILALDVAVHTQDIAQPLGLAPPVRRELFAPVVGHFGKRAAGLSLRATDLDWRTGDGPEVRGPAASLLLALANRPAGLARLEGEGLATFAARVAPLA